MSNSIGIAALGPVELTDRKFEMIHFDDSYGMHCVLAQSSIAEFEPPGSSALWLGIEKDRKGNFVYSSERHPTFGDKLPGGKMHLKLEQVKALIADLQRWVDTCSLDPNYEEKRRETSLIRRKVTSPKR